MTNDKYEVKLNVSKDGIGRLMSGLSHLIGERVKDDYDLDVDDIALYGVLQGHWERVVVAEEQKQLDQKIKDLETRRNELRA